jgi:hypothetical protein
MWLWMGVGLGAFLVVSLLVALALAAMLGAISGGVTELHEELLGTQARSLEPRPRHPRQRLRPRLLELDARQP